MFLKEAAFADIAHVGAICKLEELGINSTKQPVLQQEHSLPLYLHAVIQETS
ncbi:hypothetical protein [Bacillus manliponensis]|uniref:hypothetical protein n=1 Tax=Bacillus manliponensis TaxID=574376 RepID=UPI003515B722